MLLDLALPGEDGLTFCRRIKAEERYRTLPVIAFSAFPRQIYESRPWRSGASTTSTSRSTPARSSNSSTTFAVSSRTAAAGPVSATATTR